MSLDDLESAVSDAKDEVEALDAPLDDECEAELAMLLAGLDTDSPEELVRRAVHLLFQTTVDAGKLDFHLRSEYGVTYDEYLAGMTYDEMTGGQGPTPGGDDDYQRYQV